MINRLLPAALALSPSWARRFLGRVLSARGFFFTDLLDVSGESVQRVRPARRGGRRDHRSAAVTHASSP